MNNNFCPPQTSSASVIMPPVPQHQSSPAVISTSHSIPILQNIPPSSNIVRPVFMPTDQQSRFTDRHSYDSTSSEFHLQSPQIVDPPTLLPHPPAANIGNVPHQKNKGQSKQPQQSKTTKKPSRRQPQQQPAPQKTLQSQSSSRLTKKQQEKEDYYNRKYQLLRKCIRSLVFKNAALCDEVARLHQRIATVDAERKTVLKRLLHHERLKARRRQAAEVKKAQQQAAEAVATVSPMESTPVMCVSNTM